MYSENYKKIYFFLNYKKGMEVWYRGGFFKVKGGLILFSD